MNLVKKIKDILFEEEEDNSNVEVIKINDNVNEVKEVKEEIKEDIKSNGKEEVPSERELFKVDNNTFTFPDFDEEEFQSSLGKQSEKKEENEYSKDSNQFRQNSNVLEFERKKNIEKRNEYTKYERPERETVDREKKKFKPSPIISPVYGILNKDYKTSDIVDKTDNSKIDVDFVRRKAFENTNNNANNSSKIEPIINKNDILKEEESISEPVVTFFEEKEELPKEKEDNYKSIDTLLEEASEDIPLEDTLEMPVANNLEEIEEELEKMDEEEKQKDIDDTLEDDINDSFSEELNDNVSTKKETTSDNELFELIDSMYENREEE